MPKCYSCGEEVSVSQGFDSDGKSTLYCSSCWSEIENEYETDTPGSLFGVPRDGGTWEFG